jgi:hypothetical protein
MEAQIAQMQEMMEKMMRENEELKKKARPYVAPEITCEVNELRGLTVSGHGKYPLKLYAEQWIRLLNNKDKILKFIDNNEHKLSWISKKK